MGNAVDKANNTEAFLTEKELDEFSLLIYTHRHLSYNQLDCNVRNRFLELGLIIRFFLRKVLEHECRQEETILSTLEATRNALYRRLGWTPQMTPLGWSIRRLIWRCNSSRSWLVQRARSAAREVEERNKAGSSDQRPISITQRVPTPPKFELLATHPGGCQLRFRRAVPRRRPFKLIKNGHCMQACDLLFLVELGLEVREIGATLHLPRSTASDRIADCTNKLFELRKRDSERSLTAK